MSSPKKLFLFIRLQRYEEREFIITRHFNGFKPKLELTQTLSKVYIIIISVKDINSYC